LQKNHIAEQKRRSKDRSILIILVCQRAFQLQRPTRSLKHHAQKLLTRRAFTYFKNIRFVNELESHRTTDLLVLQQPHIGAFYFYFMRVV
jgi:hypothetical protein